MWCYAANIGQQDLYEIGLVSDDEEETAEDASVSPPEPTPELDTTPHLIEDFDLNGPSDHSVDIDEEDKLQGAPESDLLYWHHRLAHLPFNIIRAMARNGLLPARLQHAKTSLCFSCLYGKATRCPWRTSTPVNARQVPSITRPGACVWIKQSHQVQDLLLSLKVLLPKSATSVQQFL